MRGSSVAIVMAQGSDEMPPDTVTEFHSPPSPSPFRARKVCAALLVLFLASCFIGWQLRAAIADREVKRQMIRQLVGTALTAHELYTQNQDLPPPTGSRQLDTFADQVERMVGFRPGFYPQVSDQFSYLGGSLFPVSGGRAALMSLQPPEQQPISVLLIGGLAPVADQIDRLAPEFGGLTLGYTGKLVYAIVGRLGKSDRGILLKAIENWS